MIALNDSDTDPDLGPEQRAPNLRALAGLLISLAIGVGGLFALPALRSGLGLDFGVAFGLVLAIEFVAFIGVAASVLRLYRDRMIE